MVFKRQCSIILSAANNMKYKILKRVDIYGKKIETE